MKAKQFLLATTTLVVLLAALAGVASARSNAAPICSPATAISVPFTKDGAGDFCYSTASLCDHINSWNLTTLEVNGNAYTNLFAFSNSIAPVNGSYTIHYVSTVAWGHFEIVAPCSGNGATNSPTPTGTMTPVGPTPTNTGGASATRTRTPTPGGPTATRTNTPLGPTPTNTVGASATRTRTPTSVASTSTRPQLSSSVAANYTVANFLGSWTPETVNTPGSPDYTVSAGGAYRTVQAAINAAINAGGSTRKYILVSPGTYTELVFVPSGPPITLYGTGAASAVKIQQKTNSPMTGSQYRALVTAGNYTSAGQSWVNGCAAKTGAVGTTCSSAFVIQNTAFEAKNLTVTNTYAEDNPNSGGQDQAVAVYVAADQVIFDNVQLYGNQDTLWVASPGKRFYARNCYVEGDVDFIFGAGTAVFDGCQINFTAARKNGSTIGAPSTQSGNFGFLFNGGSFTGSNGASGVYFARQWPQSGLSNPVGKMIIRGATIGAFINSTAPWRDWDSSHLVNYGSASAPNLGEYQNSGAGAAR